MRRLTRFLAAGTLAAAASLTTVPMASAAPVTPAASPQAALGAGQYSAGVNILGNHITVSLTVADDVFLSKGADGVVTIREGSKSAPMANGFLDFGNGITAHGTWFQVAPHQATFVGSIDGALAHSTSGSRVSSGASPTSQGWWQCQIENMRGGVITGAAIGLFTGPEGFAAGVVGGAFGGALTGLANCH